MAHIAAAIALLAMLAGIAMGQTGAGLQYIPSGTSCPPNTLLSVQASSSTDFNGNTVLSGTVQLQNGGTFNLPFTSVRVQLINNIPVAPIFVTASCPGSSIPWSAQPYTYGQMTCAFAATVPAGGIASYPSAWTFARATLILPGGATCSSHATTIVGHPWVYSAGNIGSNIGSAIGGSIAGNTGAAIGGDIGGLIGDLAGAGSSSETSGAPGASGTGNRKLLQA